VAEIIREKCFEVLHQEVPYQMAVQVIKFDETNPELPRIFVDLWVNRESHKPIVIGKSAANLKEIGTLARTEIEKFMGVPKAFLSLNVIVKENWATSAHSMKELGYVIKN
jgi:GTP-binding protein Era